LIYKETVPYCYNSSLQCYKRSFLGNEPDNVTLVVLNLNVRKMSIETWRDLKVIVTLKSEDWKRRVETFALIYGFYYWKKNTYLSPRNIS
jgi:hypothetical protein